MTIVKEELRLLLSSLNIQEDEEVKSWIEKAASIEQPTLVCKAYLEMGIRSCIMRQKLKVEDHLIDGLMNVVLALISLGIGLAAKKL